MDNLDRLRDAVREQLSLQERIADLTEESEALSKRLNDMQMKELPDLFAEANVDRVGLPADGNHPAYDARLLPYYHANIPKTREPEAFAWLDKEGHGDLIKSVIEIRLGRGDHELAKKVLAFLDKNEIEHVTKLAVPWNTLTAFVREQVEKYGKIPPLDLLGAVVGQIVKLKERKD